MTGKQSIQAGQDLLEKIANAVSIDDLFGTVDQFRTTFDVKHAVYHSVSEAAGPYALATYSPEWAKHYEENQLYRFDPVVSAAFRSFGAYDWQTLSWQGKKLTDFRHEAIDAGVGNQGFSLPIRGPGGEFALVSVTSESDDHRWHKQRCEMESQILLLGHYLHERTQSLAGQRDGRFEVSLSPRERDVLLFLAQGLNRPNVADRLMISEHTLRVYIDSARRKLGAQNTTHAVARALQIGAIGL